MPLNNQLLSAIAGLISVIAPDAFAATTYELIDLGPGAATDVNNFNQAIGQAPLSGTWYYDGTNRSSLTFDAAYLGTQSTIFDRIKPAFVNAISDNGSIVGQANIVFSVFGVASNALIYPGKGAAVLLPYGTTATGVNRSGLVVGYSKLASVHLTTAFIYDGTNVLILARDSPQLFAVNDSGLAVGSVTVGLGGELAASFNNGQYTLLNLASLEALIHPGKIVTLTSFARSVNNAGQIVGSIRHPSDPTNTGVSLAFLYSEGVATSLGSLGGMVTEANDINNQGVIVGSSELSYRDFYNPPHAVVYSQGSVTDLNSLVTQGSENWVLTSANAVNDLGVIVGVGRKSFHASDIRQHAFLLRPTTNDLLPVITRQPGGSIFGNATKRSILPGQILRISAQGAGAPPLAYQWQLNGINITGATSPVYEVRNSSTNDTGSYQVVVSNPSGSITSNAIAIQVYPFSLSIANPLLPTLSIDGPVGRSFVVQTVDNLVQDHWENILYSILEPGGPNQRTLVWTDFMGADTSGPMRFYRVIPYP